MQKATTYRGTVNRIGICLCIMLAMFDLTRGLWSGLSTLLAAFLSAEGSYFADVLIETLYYLSCFILPAILFYRLSRRQEVEPIHWSPRMPATAPLFILTGLSLIIAAAQVNGWLTELIGYDTAETAYGGGTDPSAVMLYITVSLAPAVCEEILFRGVVYGNLRRYGRPLATLASALLFALMHENISQTFYTFVAGLALAVCYEVTGSIWCGTFLHLFNNLISCLQEILLARQGNAALPFLYILDGVLLIAGVASAIVLFWLYRRGQLSSAWPEQRASESLSVGQGSLYGSFPAALPPLPTKQPTRREAVREFFAPGMTVFVVLSALGTILSVLYAYMEAYLEELLV